MPVVRRALPEPTASSSLMLQHLREGDQTPARRQPYVGYLYGELGNDNWTGYIKLSGRRVDLSAKIWFDGFLDRYLELTVTDDNWEGEREFRAFPHGKYTFRAEILYPMDFFHEREGRRGVFSFLSNRTQHAFGRHIAYAFGIRKLRS